MPEGTDIDRFPLPAWLTGQLDQVVNPFQSTFDWRCVPHHIGTTQSFTMPIRIRPAIVVQRVVRHQRRIGQLSGYRRMRRCERDGIVGSRHTAPRCIDGGFLLAATDSTATSSSLASTSSVTVDAPSGRSGSQQHHDKIRADPVVPKPVVLLANGHRLPFHRLKRQILEIRLLAAD